MKIIPTLGIAGVLLFTGCSTDRSTGTAERRMTNDDLERVVKTRLSGEPQLGDRISVSANADKNEVTLSGTVNTEQSRSRAVALAKSAGPGLVVVDKIDVKPNEGEASRAEPSREMSRAEYTEEMARKVRDKAKASGQSIGDSMDDAWIHTKISARLVTNSATPARKIDVDVVNNVVTLRGEVESATAKEEAGRVAKETDGVKRVNNLLKVHPGRA